MKYIFRVGSKYAQILTAVAACLGQVCGGSVLAYTSSAGPSLMDTSDTASNPMIIDTPQVDWISSIVPIGAVVGSIVGSHLLEILGRRRCILWVTTPVFLVGWILVSAAVHLAMMYVGRLLTGFGLGLSISAAPMMVVETAEVSMRGYLGSLPQVMTTLGVLYSYGAGAALDWSWLGWVSGATAIPYFLLMLMVPESPVWLLSHRGRKEALEALTWLRGGDSQGAEKEVSAIQSSATEANSSSSGPALLLLRQLPYLKPFLIAVGLMFFQQLSGICAVIFNTVTIFQDAKSSLDPHISTVLVGLVQLIATIGGAVLVERVGRRPLLTISSFFMAVSMSVLGGFFYMNEYSKNAPGWLPIVSLIVYMIAFSIGYGPLAWLVGAELLPYEIMTAVNPLAVAVNWGCVFGVTFSFNSLVNSIHQYGAFWLYGAVAVAGVPFSYFCVPETKGLSHDDIKRIFHGSPPLDKSNEGEILPTTVPKY